MYTKGVVKMGIDLTVSNITHEYGKWDVKEILSMRKPYLLLNSCWSVSEEAEYTESPTPQFGPYPFTKKMLIAVLEMANANEDKEQWSWDNSRRDEYREAWQKMIDEMYEDEWHVIEWS